MNDRAPNGRGDRHSALLDAATDYALGNGLIGLTLRPLAAAIGTSDRMLIYHFGSHAGLVAAITARASDRSTTIIDSLPAAPTVAEAVNRLWAAYDDPALGRCLDLYIQAAATGLIGTEPHRTVARESHQRWAAALSDYFTRSGAPPRRVARIVALVDPALVGFHLDLITTAREDLTRGVEQLALAAQALAQPPDAALNRSAQPSR